MRSSLAGARLHRLELVRGRAIFHQAERMHDHDRADDEQQDCALAAVALVHRLVLAVDPDADAEDRDRRGQLDHAGRRHRLSQLAPIARVAMVATRSSAMMPSTTAPAPFATVRMESARFIGRPGTRHSRWWTRAGFP